MFCRIQRESHATLHEMEMVLRSFLDVGGSNDIFRFVDP